ncbi:MULTISPECIES: biopolymer transporter ExbD [unclassified Flavobacterium]|uniref:ExbD/TolR family protein n=1 Tax=unclassified Flavobacterium TaxID=196869 RepID=UPI001F1406CE|nr:MULTISPECIES: biopolymer transporter ExbD [unclassified Flavobacterium]UMY65874.1 biopolymer transporter ExbD [Flavobacterium sp. HJ-32-4]
MAKVKMSKKATSIDMTAMCDVAFLLLTFFILTATAKMPEPLPVDTPNSTVQTKLPDTDLSTITVGDGKVFFGVTDREVRKKTLELMGDQFNIKFNDDDKAKFALIETFGVPVNQVKSLLALKASDRNKAGIQPGIPHDSLDNQLKEWILNARRANDEIRGNQLNFAIKGDMKEDYPEIKKIMDILQDQNVNKFNLVTGLRNENF